MNEVVNEANIDVGGHINCGRYLLITKNTINYNIQQATYEYIPPKFLAPKNLVYDYKNNKLKWDAYPYPCVPRIYYVKISTFEIECHCSQLINRNFTIHNWYILDNNNYLECKVASCPNKIFNLSCSPFAQIIYPIILTNKVMPISVKIMIILLVVIVVCGLSIAFRRCMPIKIYEIESFINRYIFKISASRIRKKLYMANVLEQIDY
ncbi:hypothetical protein RF11_05326 [Thelohanellus kitauei]|uniref:Uncharacterized protein n=1 Tax=Thelohanellus kitauei TaxID=669202 RepID=A0A0C2N0H5_THEKT|nr:hypothetical protein RF11_05326 [Thelohanellus kitauei]